MADRLDCDDPSVEDILSNTFDGPHWLPIEFGFTPWAFSKLHPPRATTNAATDVAVIAALAAADVAEDLLTDPPTYQEAPPYQKTNPPENPTMSPEQRPSIDKHDRLSFERNRLDPATETKPNGEVFKKYIEQKMRRFGRQPRQESSEPSTTTSAASNLETVTDGALTPIQHNIDGSRTGHGEATALQVLADAALNACNTKQIIARRCVSSYSLHLPIQQEMEQNSRDELTNYSTPGSSSSLCQISKGHDSDGPSIKVERPTAEFEQDMIEFTYSLRPDRVFLQDAKSSEQYDKNTLILGQLFHSLIDTNLNSRPGQPYKSPSDGDKGSKCAPRPSKPAYVVPLRRSVNLPTEGGPTNIIEILGENEEPRIDLDIDSLLVLPKGEVLYKTELLQPSQALDNRSYSEVFQILEAVECRQDFRNPYTGTWLTRKECLLIWAIMRKVLTAPHHGFREIWTTYNKPLLDMMFTDVIQDQRETWWARADGGLLIPATTKLDCRGIVEALQKTANPKFCSLKLEVDQDPTGGYWDINAAYAIGRWIEAREPWSVRFKPAGLLARAKSGPTQRVERAVLEPLLNERGLYWDPVKPRRTTFLDLMEQAPKLDNHRTHKFMQARNKEKDAWAQSCPVVNLECVPGVEGVRNPTVVGVRDPKVEQVHYPNVDEIDDHKVEQVRKTKMEQVRVPQEVEQVRTPKVEQVHNTNVEEVGDHKVEQVRGPKVDHETDVREVRDPVVAEVHDPDLEKVRDCLKLGFPAVSPRERKELRYKPIAGSMALGQNFFLELRRQVAALQQAERAKEDGFHAAIEESLRMSGETKWVEVKHKARKSRRYRH